MRHTLLMILLVALFSAEAFAAAYICNDGFFRARKIPNLDCTPVKAVVNFEPAEPYVPATKSRPATTDWASLSEVASGTEQNKPFMLDFAKKEKRSIPFQRLPEMIENLFKNKADKQAQEKVSEEVFKKVPHPANIFDCINQVLQEGADPGSCSRMIHKKYNSED